MLLSWVRRVRVRVPWLSCCVRCTARFLARFVWAESMLKIILWTSCVPILGMFRSSCKPGREVSTITSPAGLDDGRSREEIEESILAMGILDFVKDLPMGFDTIMASGGENFSGGQRQRIAIVTALVAVPTDFWCWMRRPARLTPRPSGR